MNHLVFSSIILFICCLIYNLDTVAVLLMGWIIYLIAELKRRNIKCWLDNPTCVYLGKVSYSLYMIHFAIWLIYFLFLQKLFNGLNLSETFEFYMLSIWVVSLSLVSAVIMYRYIEGPSRNKIVKAFTKL